MENEDFNGDEHREMPVYIKAMEITKIALSIVDLVKEESEKEENQEKDEVLMLLTYADQMAENALIIPAKISGAEGADIYDLRMENATIIRKCAREIEVNCTMLNKLNFSKTDYLLMLRNEIDEFRVLFAEWVKTFDPWNYVIDRWGLFNPPGIEYDDIDPDDEL